MISNKDCQWLAESRLSSKTIQFLVEELSSDRIVSWDRPILKQYILIALQKAEARIKDPKAKADHKITSFYAWLNWLNEGEHLSQHLAVTKKLFDRLSSENPQTDFSIAFSFTPNFVYRIKGYRYPGRRKTVMDIRLDESFLYMTDTDISELAKHINDRKADRLRAIIQQIQAEPDVLALKTELQSRLPKVRIPGKAQGNFYDLKKIFDMVNGQMFRTPLPEPVLCWSSRVNTRQMGTYNFSDDVITINKGLDAKDVPEYVVRFIMYHEMLHKALGVKQTGSRRMAHTPQFRKYEKMYPDYQRAEEFLRNHRFGK